jgi:phosphonate transport system substrate-binding protein
MRRAYRLRLLLFGTILVCLSPLSATAADTGTAPVKPAAGYLLGIFPFMPLANIEGLFAPLARDIGTELGKKVLLTSSATFETMIDDIKQARFDIAYIQPFDYVKFAKSAGYVPVATRAETLTSVVVVKEGSPVTKLSQLKGRSFGMPPEFAAVSYLNRFMLGKAGLKPGTDVKMVFLASHMNCLQELMIGSVDACGVSPSALRLAQIQLKSRFRTIDTSPPVPSPLFVVKSTLPRKERDAVTRILTTTTLENVKPELRRMYYADDGKKPFIPASDLDYEPIRNLLKRIEH